MSREPQSPNAELDALHAELAQLRRQLEFFQGAVDALPFPLFWKDAQSVYVGANREQALRSGLPAGGSVAGLSDDDLPWTPQEAAAFRADDQRVMTSGEPMPLIVETQHLIGKGERLCETHKSPLRDARGQVIGVVGWYEDVTEREAQRKAQAALDERLRQAHKQDSLVTLAGGIAHDFNNILASIMANLWLVEQALPQGHPASESLADIQEAGLRAKRLVEQLISLKQKQPRELAPVSLGAVVVDASRLLRASIPPQVALTTEIESDAPVVVGDAAQLHQVVMNLCKNAALATQELPRTDPRVELRVATRELDAEAVERLPGQLAPGSYLVLTVSDNGAGMDAETQLRIFEPFFTTRQVGEGSGLGLSVVQGIVNAHRGTIEFQSAPGRGTTMRVYLPRAPLGPVTPPTRVAARPSSRPPAGVKHVMCVDDDPAILRVVTRLLRRAGCRVTTFEDPREASGALLERPKAYDLLLLDFSMPHLSGLELARKALALRPELPVVMITGYVNADLRRDAERMGLLRVCNKVDLVAEIEAVIRAVLSPEGQP